MAVRPSGTEPKVKYYMFTYEPAEQLANLDDTKSEHAARLAAAGPRPDGLLGPSS